MNLRHPAYGKSVVFFAQGIEFRLPLTWVVDEKIEAKNTVKPNAHPLYMPTVTGHTATHTINMKISFAYEDDPKLDKEANALEKDNSLDLREQELKRHLRLAKILKAYFKTIAAMMATERYNNEPTADRTFLDNNAKVIAQHKSNIKLSHEQIEEVKNGLRKDHTVARYETYIAQQEKALAAAEAKQVKADQLTIGKVTVPFFGAEFEVPGFLNLMCSYFGKSTHMLSGYLSSFESTYNVNNMTETWKIVFIEQNLTQVRRKSKSDIFPAKAGTGAGIKNQ